MNHISQNASVLIPQPAKKSHVKVNRKSESSSAAEVSEIPRVSEACETYTYNPIDRGHLVRRPEPVWGNKADRLSYEGSPWLQFRHDLDKRLNTLESVTSVKTRIDRAMEEFKKLDGHPGDEHGNGRDTNDAPGKVRVNGDSLWFDTDTGRPLTFSQQIGDEVLGYTQPREGIQAYQILNNSENPRFEIATFDLNEGYLVYQPFNESESEIIRLRRAE